jgi:hypothetical protein
MLFLDSHQIRFLVFLQLNHLLDVRKKLKIERNNYKKANLWKRREKDEWKERKKED